MTGATLARLVASARVAFGGALLVRPETIRLLWGDREDRATVQSSIRALGARDMILGLGVHATLRVNPEAAPRWVLSSAVVDALDVVCMALTEARLPPRHRVAVITASGVSAALGFLAWRGLETVEDQPSPPAAP